MRVKLVSHVYHVKGSTNLDRAGLTKKWFGNIMDSGTFQAWRPSPIFVSGCSRQTGVAEACLSIYLRAIVIEAFATAKTLRELHI